jgi:hypothetical protein
MNHFDPQLVDTPTARDAAAPVWPSRMSSKYRFLAWTGIRFCPPRGIRTSPPGAFATIEGIQGVYPVLFIGALVVKLRDGQVVNRLVYVVIGSRSLVNVTLWGCGPGMAAKGPKFWLAVGARWV